MRKSSDSFACWVIIIGSCLRICSPKHTRDRKKRIAPFTLYPTANTPYSGQSHRLRAWIKKRVNKNLFAVYLYRVYQTVNNRRELSCGAFMKEVVCKASWGVIMPPRYAWDCHRKRIVLFNKLFLIVPWIIA